MGLFSGKKKTYRDFSYSRLIDDDYLPDVIGQAITTYVLDKDNNKTLTDLMLEYGWSANNVKWDAAYRWADKGKYYYGLPTASVVTETDFTGAESLEEVLQTLTGQQDLSYVYSMFGPGNFRHAMWQLLVSNQSYNATTNILASKSTELGTTCWLQDATNYLTPATVNAVTASMLEHWGYSPTSGATNVRAQDLNATDTPDAVSTTGENFARIEYACSFAGVERIKTVETTKVTTTVRTPNGSGGYDDETSTSSSDTTSNDTNWNGVTLPPDIISSTDVGTGTTETTETDPDDTQTTTDPDTGVITIVLTQVSRVITTTAVTINVIAYFDMSFGSYDYNPASEDIDTDTVLDDSDSGIYDPDAVLDPSGEDTDDSDDLFMVCYEYTVGTTLHIGYFTYVYGSGSYPSLDGIKGTEVSDFGQHFPRMYFRLDGNKLPDDSNSETEAYKTSVKLGNKLDLPWLKVSDELYDSLSSLDKIRDVLMILMVPANTENAIEQEYLYKYFYTLCMVRPEYTEDLWYTTTTGNSSTGSDEVPASELDDFDVRYGAFMESTDTHIATSNSMDAIGYARKTGTIGAKGAVASGRGTAIFPIRYSLRASGKVTYKYGTRSVGYHYYQYQVNDTEYDEVRVYNLVHQVRVGGTQVDRSGDSDELMVPLDHAFRKEFSAHDRETLYARATQILICTEYTVKTKWYQTGIFQAVTVVIAVAMSWWTGGASLTLVGALTAAATAVGAYIAFSLLSKYVFSKLGSWASILATAVAIVAMAYGGYLAISGTTGPFSLTAQNLMQASNYAFQTAGSAQKGELIALNKKTQELQREIEEGNSMMEAAQDQLNQGSNTISDWLFLGASYGLVKLGETPEQMIGRTLNTNVGLIALQLPDVYLAQALSLPSDTEIMQNMQQSLYTQPEDALNPLI